MVLSGEVVEVKDGVVSVVFDRPKACANCNGCLSQQCTRVDLQAQADIGDILDVEMPDKNILQASSIAYVIPLVALVAGLFIGAALYAPLHITFSKDLFIALAAILCLAAGLLAVALIDRALQGKDTWKPKVVAVRQKSGGSR